jgi:cysteate synthase
LNPTDEPAISDTLVATRHYLLICQFCGRRSDDDGVALTCREEHPPALLRTEYAGQSFSPRYATEGLFRYQDWLPVIRTRIDTGRTVVYRSTGLARALGVQTLWIAFNGYWPERGARLQTGTFKELEAYTVLGRLPAEPVIPSMASSGNTGAAFAWACSQSGIPCVIVVPETGMHRMRFREPLAPLVTIVTIEGAYPEAISLAAAIGRIPTFQIEGGVKNVGRRDGLGTVLLSAYERMHRLPTQYFQAVGSGTGAIAVMEAAHRLRASGCGDPLPHLMLCQNAPFTPIYDAWRRDPDSIDLEAPARYRAALQEVVADELTNTTPPYAIIGGVRDALATSRGEVFATDNAAVHKAMNMFCSLEGIDIEPAAGVAVAGLSKAAERGKIGRDDVVLLNVTGGGRDRLAQDCTLIPAEPALRISGRAAEDLEETAARIAEVAYRHTSFL